MHYYPRKADKDQFVVFWSVSECRVSVLNQLIQLSQIPSVEARQKNLTRNLVAHRNDIPPLQKNY